MLASLLSRCVRRCVAGRIDVLRRRVGVAGSPCAVRVVRAVAELGRILQVSLGPPTIARAGAFRVAHELSRRVRVLLLPPPRGEVPCNGLFSSLSFVSAQLLARAHSRPPERLPVQRQVRWWAGQSAQPLVQESALPPQLLDEQQPRPRPFRLVGQSSASRSADPIRREAKRAAAWAHLATSGAFRSRRSAAPMM